MLTFWTEIFPGLCVLGAYFVLWWMYEREHKALRARVEALEQRDALMDVIANAIVRMGRWDSEMVEGVRTWQARPKNGTDT